MYDIKQGNGFTDDSVIYRIEFATSFTPYAGPLGRVADACFAGTENPFARAACLVTSGPCAGQADGASCDDGNACNGADACQSGVCQHTAAPADGTSCASSNACQGGGTCQSGQCVGGATLPDGTPCPDGDPCNGTELCQAGACAAGTAAPEPLDLRAIAVRGGSMTLTGDVIPIGEIAPSTTDAVTLALDAAGAPLFGSTLAHPGSDGFWLKSEPPVALKYKDGAGSAGGLALFQMKQRGLGHSVKAKGRSEQLFTLQGGAVVRAARDRGPVLRGDGHVREARQELPLLVAHSSGRTPKRSK